MNDDQLALLRNIRANPDDNLARLVYADWVEEQGDKDLGDLIRLHIERERAESGSPAYFNLITQSAMLLAQHRDRWTDELRQRFGVTGVEFNRGIPEEVELPLTSFGGVAEELFGTLPIRHVMFTGVKTLAKVRELKLPSDVARSVAAGGFDHNLAMRGFDLPRHTLARRTLTLLDPAPAGLEPQLRYGRWRILCPAVWHEPDLQAESAFFNHFRREPDFVTSHGILAMAIRQFHRPGEFATWCPLPSSEAGPHWIDLEDGKLISHRSGFEPPRDDPEDDYYDGDLE
ncbi:MAG: TIGR02996 domain-containing protein [Fimbriiglobus sp.]